MKWIFVLLIVVTFFCLVVLPVSGAEQKPTAMVTDFSINPPILNPGDIATITVIINEIGTVSEDKSVDNEDAGTTNGTTWDDTVYIEKVSLEGNGLIILSPVFDHMGQIGSDRSMQFTFLVRAPPKSGIYYPEVWMDTDGGPSRFPFPVNVNTAIGNPKQAIIILKNSYPEFAKPGDEIPVRITIQNDGMTLADDIILTFDSENPDIAPISSNKYYVGGLYGVGWGEGIMNGEKKSVDVMFISDNNIDAGLHKIPATLQYTSIDGSVRTEDASVFVMIGGNAELGFVPVNASSRLVTAGQPFEILIPIKNAGTGQAKQVVATIDLPMSGTRQTHIGKIEPGGEAPAVFMINGGAEGSYVYNATIKYEDDAGTHTETRQMTLRVNPDPLFWIKILILLLLIGSIGLVYRYWYLPKKSGNGAFPWFRKS